MRTSFFVFVVLAIFGCQEDTDHDQPVDASTYLETVDELVGPENVSSKVHDFLDKLSADLKLYEENISWRSKCFVDNESSSYRKITFYQDGRFVQEKFIFAGGSCINKKTRDLRTVGLIEDLLFDGEGSFSVDLSVERSYEIIYQDSLALLNDCSSESPIVGQETVCAADYKMYTILKVEDQELYLGYSTSGKEGFSRPTRHTDYSEEPYLFYRYGTLD